jgi:hypothetical protein
MFRQAARKFLRFIKKNYFKIRMCFLTTLQAA